MKPPQSRKAAKAAPAAESPHPAPLLDVHATLETLASGHACRNTSPWRAGFVDYINPASATAAERARGVLGHMERVIIEPTETVMLSRAVVIDAASPYIAITTGHGELDTGRTTRTTSD